MATGQVECEVFATRDEAIKFVEAYYSNPNNHWFGVRERAAAYKKAGEMFKEQSGGWVPTTAITGCEVKLPIVRPDNGPFWKHVAPEAYRNGKFSLGLTEMSDEDFKEILKARSKFRPSLVYTTVDRMVKDIEARSEGPIRKDDIIFSTIRCIQWGWDTPIKYAGIYNAKISSRRLSQALEAWTKSEQGKSFNKHLREIKEDREKHNGMKVKRVVAIALGTMSEDAAVYQHCLAIGLAKELGVRDIFMQDPAYTTSDKKALHEYGVKITTDDRIFNHIYSDSIVICIAPAIPVLEMMCAKIHSFNEWPAMLIWENIRWTCWHPDRCTPRVQTMMKKYEMVDLATKLDENEFLDTKVYVRRREEDFAGKQKA